MAFCPECGAKIIACDNCVNLDYPAVRFDDVTAPWRLMRVGSEVWAGVVGDADSVQLGYSFHEHQPEGSA